MMNEQQLQQLVQQVAQALAQGADPNQIMQELVNQGIPEDVASKVIQASMQMVQRQGGQQGQPAQGGQGGGVIEQFAQEDPELLFAVLQEWESLDQQTKQQLMQALQEAAQGGGQQQQQSQQPQNQGSGMF